jgi:hypothetical protein
LNNFVRRKKKQDFVLTCDYFLIRIQKAENYSSKLGKELKEKKTQFKSIERN